MTTYHCPTHIVWVQDAHHIILVDGQAGASYTLQGVEAALWNWLRFSLPYPQLVAWVAAALKLPLADGAIQVHTILRRWQQMGIIENGEPHH